MADVIPLFSYDILMDPSILEKPKSPLEITLLFSIREFVSKQAITLLFVTSNFIVHSNFRQQIHLKAV